MTCSHWKNQTTTPSSSPRFSGQSDQITIDGRPVPLQSGVLPDDFVQRLDALKKASGLTGTASPRPWAWTAGRSTGGAKGRNPAGEPCSPWSASPS